MAAPSFAQQQELDSLSQKVAQVALKARQPGDEKVRVVVFVFHRNDDVMTELGTRITGELSERLSHAASIELITRAQMEDTRKKEFWDEAEWSLDSVAFSVAHTAGAQVLVVGTYRRVGQDLRVDTQVLLVPKGNKLGAANVQFRFSPELRALDAKMIAYPSAQDATGKGSPEEMAKQYGAAKVGVAGIKEPECRHCPDPQFTSEARGQNYSGKVLLAVIIDENGLVKDLQVVKPAPYGLTGQAIRAVRAWKFKPATKDGKPIPIMAFIEVTFRLF